MKNTANITFRCKGNPRVTFTPEYMFDVEGMRKHPDYDEIDADGNVVDNSPNPDQVVHRIPVRDANPMEPPKAVRKRK